jgi:hypothetical protein
MGWMKTVSVAALMCLPSPGVAPGVTARPRQVCPRTPSLESHARIATGTAIRWYSGLIDRVNFRGQIQIVLVPDSNEPQSAHVRVLSLREEGESQYSRFTFEAAQGNDAPVGTLKCLQGNPARMRLTYALNLLLTAQSSDGAEVGHLRMKKPAVQSVELNQWPPSGEVFQLHEPIELFLIDTPDEVAATIAEYPTQERGDAIQLVD